MKMMNEKSKFLKNKSKYGMKTFGLLTVLWTGINIRMISICFCFFYFILLLELF